MSYSASFASGSASASASAPASASASGSFSASFAQASRASSVRSQRSQRSVRSVRSSRSNAGSSAGNQSSQIEQAIRQASKPIDINETEQITANGVTGIHANKQETAGLDLSKYQLYNDPNPEIIRKQLEKIKQKQVVQIKYLRPPPVKAGNIIIRQQPDKPSTPAPPLVIRVPGKPDPCACKPNPCNPCGGCSSSPAGPGCGPIVIREAPPKTPCPLPEKVVTIPGKKIPPPPRKVVIEKLPDAPKKPQDIVIEKWLPYEEPARKVVFEPAASAAPAENPRNVVIEWVAGEVEVEKEIVNLGVFDADPREYRQKYQFNKSLKDLPPAAAEANSQNAPRRSNDAGPILEGDLQALALIDLDEHGLGYLRSFVKA